MLWVYDDLIESDNAVRFYGPCSPNFDALGFDFSRAQKHPNTENIPPIELVIPELQTGEMCDNLSVPPCFGMLVSKNLRQVFDSLDISHIQWYQAVIKNSDGEIVSDEYFLGNNLYAIEAIDFERSELELDEDDGSIDFIDKLVIKDDLHDLPHIFRLKEFLPLQVLTEELKKAIVSSGCTGIEFLKPEELKL